MNCTRISFLAVSLSLLTTSAVFAGDDQKTSVPAPPPTAPGPAPNSAPTTSAMTSTKPPAVNYDDQIICKKDDDDTSRLPTHKICLTRREWRQH